MEISEEKKVIDEREALVEMYKSGFLDAFRIHNNLKTDEDWRSLNKFYKLAFLRRFEKGITKALKKK